MDNNLRDSVEKIVHNINVGNLCEGDVALSDIAGEDEVGEATTALCSLFAEREIEIIDDLVYAVKHTSFCKCDVCKVINKLKDKKGIEQ